MRITMHITRYLRHCRILIVTLLAAALPLFVGVSAPTTAFAAAHRTWFVTVGVQTSSGAFSGMAFTPREVFVKQGDTIVWTVGAKEIHTVAFGAPPADTDNESAEGITNPILNTFEEAIELFAKPAGGQSFDGVSYHNSGIMTTTPAASGFPQAIQRYSLTINAPVGAYTFYCLVHGPMMSQIVHVIPNSQAYPFTQMQYNAQAEQQRERIFAQGKAELARTLDDLPGNVVYAGPKVSIGQADVMRFIRTTTTIKVNRTVTFSNVSMDPHTVTIGADQSIPGGGILPFGDLNNVKQGESVSSGLFGAGFSSLGLPTSVTFRFTQPGVYHFHCIFHDYEGMVGTIIVTN